MSLTCEARQHFRQTDTGNRCLDRLELTADPFRSVGLGIPGVDVAGRSLEVEQKHRLRFAEPIASLDRSVGLRASFVAQNIWQGEPEERQRPGSEQIAAGWRIAQTAARPEEGEHGTTRGMRQRERS